MPFPPGVPTVRVTYTAASPAGGQPAQGTVEFAPVAPAVILPDHGIVFSGRGVYRLDEQGRLVDTDGTVGVPLLPCDIPGANPAEWVWMVTITLTNAGPRRFCISLSTTQTEVDLHTVDQVAPSRAYYVAVPGPRGETGPPGPQGPPATDAETPAGALEKIAAHAAAADPHGDRAWASEQFSALSSRVAALEGTGTAAPPSVTGSRSDGTALANLITVLAAAGLITDDTTE
ncbi:hypothetical protein ACH4TP_37815 [Streptomyces sp. NPDC021012]|uniref:hypothetical protein n=1 Tax=Streptomyces sp. NPDC021012 TaxID=3365107 RepID=UPI0037987ED2